MTVFRFCPRAGFRIVFTCLASIYAVFQCLSGNVYGINVGSFYICLHKSVSRIWMFNYHKFVGFVRSRDTFFTDKVFLLRFILFLFYFVVVVALCFFFYKASIKTQVIISFWKHGSPEKGCWVC